MLRLLSPIQLCLCLPLFFLPWVEVQCIPKAPPVGAKPDPMMVGMPTGPQPLIAQSGFQAATGGFTFSNPLLAGEGGMGGGLGGMGGPNAGPPKVGPKKDGGPPAAPLLFLFPVALLAGIVVGFLPMKGAARKLILAACCVVALGTIAVQAGVLGFPLLKAVEEDAAKDNAKGGGGGPKQLEPGMTLKLAWKVPLYATVLFLVGALVTSFLGGGKPVPKSRRRRDEYDDRDHARPRRRPADDEDDRDEDDRPRRRARREE